MYIYVVKNKIIRPDDWYFQYFNCGLTLECPALVPPAPSYTVPRPSTRQWRIYGIYCRRRRRRRPRQRQLHRGVWIFFFFFFVEEGRKTLLTCINVPLKLEPYANKIDDWPPARQPRYSPSGRTRSAAAAALIHWWIDERRPLFSDGPIWFRQNYNRVSYSSPPMSVPPSQRRPYSARSHRNHFAITTRQTLYSDRKDSKCHVQ